MHKLKSILLILFIGLLVKNLSVSPASAQDINWQNFDKALAMTDTTSRHVLVDVSAPWCGWCRKMKKEVYPALDKILSDHFILARINRDDNNTTHQYRGNRYTSTRLAQHFKVQQVPALVILNPEGKYITHMSGFIEADNLRSILQYFATESYLHQSFKEYENQ